MASRAKGEFLANMSHGIRTPLNVILRMAHLIRRSGTTAEQAEQLDKLESAGEHLLEACELILMDMQMPTMDGLQATPRIRALALHDETPIIALTANALAEHRTRCRDAGMNDFLTKPIDPEALYRALLRWLPPIGLQSEHPESTD